VSADGGGALRVLVVDDNLDAAETLMMLLEMMGHDVKMANDGQEAIAVATREQPRVVLLDIGMPGMNGYDVARALREQPETRDVVLVAMTGWGQEEDMKRTKEAGFNHHLVKPVEPSVLSNLLDRIAAGTA
jgi:two-component system, chemotaxis family, CheB/CheR fusion protein